MGIVLLYYERRGGSVLIMGSFKYVFFTAHGVLIETFCFCSEKAAPHAESSNSLQGRNSACKCFMFYVLRCFANHGKKGFERTVEHKMPGQCNVIEAKS